MQRLFTRKLTGFGNVIYPRSKALNLPSLELRRLRSDLVFCFKIVNGLRPVASSFGEGVLFGFVNSLKGRKPENFFAIKSPRSFHIKEIRS